MEDGVITARVLFDYGATFVWALTGALIAARRGYDGRRRLRGSVSTNRSVSNGRRTNI